MNRKNTKSRGFTLTEVVVSMAIIAVLSAAFIITLSGTRASDKIDRGAQLIYNDLTYVRSRAVSTNTLHRINFTSSTEWRIEIYNGSAWAAASNTRTMPADTNLTSASFANAGANLQATSRGLFEFVNGATGEPYVTIASYGVSKTKSITVAVGGALDFETN